MRVCVYVYVGVVHVCIDRSVHVYVGSIHMCVCVYVKKFMCEYIIEYTRLCKLCYVCVESVHVCL